VEFVAVMRRIYVVDGRSSWNLAVCDVRPLSTEGVTEFSFNL